MARPGRLGMTNTQKEEFWHRWRHGESIHDINHAPGNFRTSLSAVLRLHNGFTLPLRKRSQGALTLEGQHAAEIRCRDYACKPDCGGMFQLPAAP